MPQQRRLARAQEASHEKQRELWLGDRVAEAAVLMRQAHVFHASRCAHAPARQRPASVLEVGLTVGCVLTVVNPLAPKPVQRFDQAAEQAREKAATTKQLLKKKQKLKKTTACCRAGRPRVASPCTRCRPSEGEEDYGEDEIFGVEWSALSQRRRQTAAGCGWSNGTVTPPKTIRESPKRT